MDSYSAAKSGGARNRKATTENCGYGKGKGKARNSALKSKGKKYFGSEQRDNSNSDRYMKEFKKNGSRKASSEL
eukprot:Awhi_evm1s8504